MAYDDDYIYAPTMQDTCNADPGDAPGMNVDCKFIAPGEDITTFVANRPHLQLAINCDVLKTPLDNMLAVAEVATLTAFSGNSITIDPTGGGGSNINFIGHLYLGNASYSPLDPEHYNTLFQLLDEDYNEVTVGGEEVRVINTAPVAIGTGFYNAGVVTLTLSHVIPSANYRLGYGRGATLATLPDDALIKADIRGLHEAAGESGYRSVWVCAKDGAPADYVGNNAIGLALADLGDDCTLFVRNGTYNYAAHLAIANKNITIVGESEEGVILKLDAGVYNFNVTGNNVKVSNLTISVGGSIILAGEGDELNCVRGIGSFGSELGVGNNSRIIDCDFQDVQLHPNNVWGFLIEGTIARGANERPLRITESKGRIVNSSFVADQLTAGDMCFQYSDSVFMPNDVTIENVSFESNVKIIGTSADLVGTMTFKDVKFVNAGSGLTFYNDNAVELLAAKPPGDMDSRNIPRAGIVLEDCSVYDIWSTGSDGVATQRPVVHLKNVVARNLKVSRKGYSSVNYYLDGGVVLAESCVIHGLDIFVDGLELGGGGMGGAYLTQVAAADGVALVCNKSRIEELSVRNVSSEGNVGVPLISMLGDSSDTNDAERAVIDGLRIGWLSAHNWSDLTIQGGIVTMRGYSELLRFHYYAAATEEGKLESVVLMTGFHNRLHKSNFRNSVASDENNQRFVRIEGAGSLLTRVEKCDFYLTTPAVAPITVKHHAIDASPSSASKIFILDNNVHIDGLIDNVWAPPIFLDAAVAFSKVSGNVIYSDTSNGVFLIDVAAADLLPATIGSDFESGCNDIRGNTLISPTTLALPIVNYAGTACKNNASNIVYAP